MGVMAVLAAILFFVQYLMKIRFSELLVCD
jgi:hypothetical protein